MNVAVRAQYVPNNSQAFQLAPVYNPAFSGVEDFTDLKLSYRHQWTGYGPNSPSYGNLSFNARLKRPLDLSHNSMRMSNPSAVHANLLPRKKRIIHGFGINVFQSKFGAILSAGGSFNYAWNYPLTKKIRLAIGASSLIENRRIHLEDLTFDKPDPYYQHLLQSPSSQLDLSFRGGLLIYSKGFYLGASYLSITNKSIEASDIAFEEPFYRASFQMGFSIDLSPALTLKPSTLAYLQIDDNILIDYNIKTYFNNKGWVGVTYRNSNTGIFLLGFHATPFLSATYSYEIGFGELQQFGGSSHELILGFRISNSKKQDPYIW